MNFLSNVVKLSDYPFAYSLVGLILLITGHKIDWANANPSEFIPLITLIGVLGTTLSIIDPFGNLLRYIIKLKSEKISYSFRGMFHRYIQPVDWAPPLTGKSLLTNWMVFEIDKTVSIIYFVIILSLIFYSLFSPSTLNNMFKVLNTVAPISTNQISNTTKNSGCKDNACLPIDSTLLRVVILVALITTALVAVTATLRLLTRNRLVVVYFAINESVLPKLSMELKDESMRISNNLQEIRKSLDNKRLGHGRLFYHWYTKYNTRTCKTREI